MEKEKIIIEDHTECQECSEDYIFLMQDNNGKFTLGLQTILECLAIAQEVNAIPEIPSEWWNRINNRY